jgi:hypothetical protein
VTGLPRADFLGQSQVDRPQRQDNRYQKYQIPEINQCRVYYLLFRKQEFLNKYPEFGLSRY